MQEQVLTYPRYDENALCTQVGVEVYFPEPGVSAGFEIEEAKRLCARCYFKSACAEWAIHHERHGIWGGLTPRERQRIRAERGISIDGEFFSDQQAIAARGVA